MPPARSTAARITPRAPIGGLDGLDHRRQHAAVTHHVRVCEVDDRECVAVAEPLREARGNACRRHPGREVVGRHVTARRHELPVLADVVLLAAAVEEIRHVRVLLGLRDVQLAQAGRLQRVGERALQGLVVEHHERLERGVVARHRDEQPDRPCQRVTDLPRAVGPEVEEHERIARCDAQRRIAEDDGRHELVGETAGIARLDRRSGPLCALPAPSTSAARASSVRSAR